MGVQAVDQANFNLMTVVGPFRNVSISKRGNNDKNSRTLNEIEETNENYWLKDGPVTFSFSSYKGQRGVK